MTLGCASILKLGTISTRMAGGTLSRFCLASVARPLDALRTESVLSNPIVLCCTKTVTAPRTIPPAWEH